MSMPAARLLTTTVLVLALGLLASNAGSGPDLDEQGATADPPVADDADEIFVDCACGAAVDATGIAIDLGPSLGTGLATLTAAVCPTCTARGSTLTFSFVPSVEIGSTPFTFRADRTGPPQCTLVPDELGLLGTIVVSGDGTIETDSAQQSTLFTLTLVRTAGLVCTATLVLDSATALGFTGPLTIPSSIACGDLVFAVCPVT